MTNTDQIQRLCARAAPWAAAGVLAYLTGCVTKPRPINLEDVYALLQQKQFVDLMHAFEPGIPHWPGFPDEQREILYWYEPNVGKRGTGFFAEEYYHVGQRN